MKNKQANEQKITIARMWRNWDPLCIGMSIDAVTAENSMAAPPKIKT